MSQALQLTRQDGNDTGLMLSQGISGTSRRRNTLRVSSTAFRPFGCHRRLVPL